MSTPVALCSFTQPTNTTNKQPVTLHAISVTNASYRRRWREDVLRRQRVAVCCARLDYATLRAVRAPATMPVIYRCDFRIIIMIVVIIIF